MPNNSCFSQKDNALNFIEAKEKCLSAACLSLSTQKITLDNALNRVLATNLIAPINVPNHTNSAMDGYALREQDLNSQQVFKVVATAFAGKPYLHSIKKNQCVQVMTGAAMPDNADYVVPQEFIQKNGEHIRVEDYWGGDNVRQMGEDIKKGSVVLPAGRLITSADLGLIASVGIFDIAVYRRLKVAFFSTGDELCAAGKKPQFGQIYDSNRYCLRGLLTRLNIDFLDLGIVADDKKQLKKSLLAAAKSADVIITSGGVSVGEADFIKAILNEIGAMNFCNLAIKPGRPLTFGKIQGRYFFALPGNPVATMVTFYQIVQPFLKTLMGQIGNIEAPLLVVKSLSAINKKGGRYEFLRAQLSESGVKVLPQQGSGVLSSLVHANCFVVLESEQKSVKIGDEVKIQPFYGLF